MKNLKYSNLSEEEKKKYKREKTREKRLKQIQEKIDLLRKSWKTN